MAVIVSGCETRDAAIEWMSGTARTGYYPACRGGVPKADLGNQWRISLKQQHSLNTGKSYFAIPMTPHATRAPEFPVGWLL